MRNFTLKPAFTETDHKSNYNVINQHVDDIYYINDYFPSDVSLIGNATTGSVAATEMGIDLGNERISVINFSNGSVAECKLSVLSHKYWIIGNLELTLYWTGSTSNTNNVRFSYVRSQHALSEDIGAAGTSSISANETTAGPATLETLKKYTFTTYAPFSREYELNNYRIFRDSTHGDDTYTGDVYIAAVRLRFIPALNQEGSKGVE